MSIANLFTSHNISLKENKIFFLFSQIENQRFSTSLNNNIIRNSDTSLAGLVQLNSGSLK